MRTKPIFECTLHPTIWLKNDAVLTTEHTNIISINGIKNSNTIKIPVDPNIKLFLDDFITLSKLPKSIFISYVYIILRDNAYICYDAISVKDGQDNKETLTPASFIKGEAKFIKGQLGEILKEAKSIKGKLEEILNNDHQYTHQYTHQLNQLLQSGHVHLNVDFEKINLNYKDNGKQAYEFIIHQKIKFFRYPWGEDIKLLPMPKLPEPGNAPKHGQLFGIDDDGCHEIWDSIEKLNTILRTPGNKKVFIKGEPGSGKEVFAHAIHYGSVRSKPNNLVVRAVAGADTQELRELLFGREVDGVSLPGLIEKADGGTLFLDEFDKINKDFYSELLRVLEAEEYVPFNGKKTREVGDVNWIFAGAFMGTGVSNAKSDLPQDFWSRLTSYIEIENPIKFQLTKDAKINGTPSNYSYAEVIFLYFFLQKAVEKGQDVDNITTNNEGDFRSNIVRKLFVEKENNGLLKPHKKLYDFARKFNEKIDGIDGGKYYSKTKFPLFIFNHEEDLFDCVRSIRQAAKVAFSKCYYSALKEKDPADFWKNLEKKDKNTPLKEAVESVKIARKT